MAVTTGDSIYYTTGTQPESASNESSTQASSVQRAFDKRQQYTFVWSNATARTAQTGMVQGSTGYQVDTKTNYVYDNSAWRLASSYAEYTAPTQSVPNAAYTAPTALALSSGTSTDTTFTSISAGVLNIVNPGIYALSVTGSGSPALGTTNFIDVTYDAAHNNIISISPFTAGVATVSIPFLNITAANTKLYLWLYQNGGSTQAISTILRVGRIA